MWHTSQGDRKLVNLERRLFVEGALRVLRFIRLDDELTFRVPQFDRMEVETRKYSILHVTDKLTNGEPAAPPEAWEEAAIAAVFEHIKDDTRDEITTEVAYAREGQSGCRRCRRYMRKLIRAVAMETGVGTPLDPEFTDMGRWDSTIEDLADCILLDRDSAMECTQDVPLKFSKEDRKRLSFLFEKLRKENP